MAGAGDNINNSIDFVSWGELEKEAHDAAEKEAREIHELLKKLLIERINFEANLQAKLLAINEANKLKIQLDMQKRALKKAFKDTEEEEKYKAKLRKKYDKQAAQDEALERRNQRLKEYEELKKRNEELNEAFGNSLTRNIQTAYAKYQAEGGVGKVVGKELKRVAGQTILSAAKLATESVTSATTMLDGVYSKMNARLQGSTTNAQNIVDLMNKNIAASPFIKYEEMMNNTASLIEQGIAYNVEERAFLMTIKDKIADTFDVANGTLLQIIRIQQQDSTRARMGMEASLTLFLNNNFQDTSYLSQVYDTVTDAVADSVVQLGTKGGAEYEYQMQKWLGSLYSMGLSSNTVTSLASAINMLATGDIQGLEGSGMLNLLVMAANKSGMNYGDLLSLGVNASNVNALMSNIVSYWSELALNNNQVVRKLYANLFGLDMADLVAIRNINQGIFDDIKGANLSYQGMEIELSNLLSMVRDRMHISELVNTAYKNALTGIGLTVANAPSMMATWLINDMIKDATGGINIPFIEAMGTGVDLNADLNSLMLLAIVGGGALGLIGNVISSISNQGGLNLAAWGHSDTTSRGAGLGGVVSGVQSTTSRTTFVGNANSSDIYSSTLNSAYDNVDKTVAGEAVEDADKLKKSIVENIDPSIKAILELLQSVRSGSALRVKVEDYGLTSPF